MQGKTSEEAISGSSVDTVSAVQHVSDNSLLGKDEVTTLSV